MIKYFTAITIHCSCQKIRSVLKYLGYIPLNMMSDLIFCTWWNNFGKILKKNVQKAAMSLHTPRALLWICWESKWLEHLKSIQRCKKLIFLYKLCQMFNQKNYLETIKGKSYLISHEGQALRGVRLQHTMGRNPFWSNISFVTHLSF